MATKKTPARKTTKKITAKKAPAPKQAKAPKLPNPKAVEKVRAEVKPKERDPRLPPVGTTIEKTDRHGTVRTSCTVEEGGIRYGGVLYPSLSGAARAAAKRLGLGDAQLNGFVFWGLQKAAVAPEDLKARIDERWGRFLASAIAGAREPAIAGHVLDRLRVFHADFTKALEGFETDAADIARTTKALKASIAQGTK